MIGVGDDVLEDSADTFAFCSGNSSRTLGGTGAGFFFLRAVLPPPLLEARLESEDTDPYIDKGLSEEGAGRDRRGAGLGSGTTG